MKKMKYTEQEFAELKEKQAKQNALYKEANAEQIKKWLSGVSEHNTVDRISSIIDKDGAEVDFYTLPGGECCPDFSCCTGVIWPLSERQAFTEAHEKGDTKKVREMLTGSLSNHIVKRVPGTVVVS